MNEMTGNPTPIEPGSFSEPLIELFRASQKVCRVIGKKILDFTKKLEDAATEARRIDRKVRASRERDHAQLSLFPRE